MKQRNRIIIPGIFVVLILLLAAVIFLPQRQNSSASADEYPRFEFGFVQEADVPTLMAEALSPAHVIEETPANGEIPSITRYDGEGLAPWLLNCETMDRVERFGDIVYVSYRPIEPQNCDMVVLHYRNDRIVHIVTSWDRGTHFLEVDLVDSRISGG